MPCKFLFGPTQYTRVEIQRNKPIRHIYDEFFCVFNFEEGWKDLYRLRRELPKAPPKPGAARGYAPSDAIARLSSGAREESADFSANGDREAACELNDVAGRVDGDDCPLGEEPLARSPVALSRQREEAAPQDEEEVEETVIESTETDKEEIVEIVEVVEIH